MKALFAALCASLKGAVGSTAASIGKKLAVVVVGLVLDSVRVSHPDWPLPSADLTRDLVIAFLSCHTLTDVAYTLKTAFPEVLREMAARNAVVK